MHFSRSSQFVFSKMRTSSFEFRFAYAWARWFDTIVTSGNARRRFLFVEQSTMSVIDRDIRTRCTESDCLDHPDRRTTIVFVTNLLVAVELQIRSIKMLDHSSVDSFRWFYHRSVLIVVLKDMRDLISMQLIRNEWTTKDRGISRSPFLFCPC